MENVRDAEGEICYSFLPGPVGKIKVSFSLNWKTEDGGDL